MKLRKEFIGLIIVAVCTAFIIWLNTRPSRTESLLAEIRSSIDVEALRFACQAVVKARSSYTNETSASWDIEKAIQILPDGSQYKRIPPAIRAVRPRPHRILIETNRLVMVLPPPPRAFIEYSPGEEPTENDIVLTNGLWLRLVR